jgi:MSHA biogenesis protein MshN
MSVINQVLKELDRQGANPALPRGVIAVEAEREIASHRMVWLAGGLGVALAAAWWFWPAAPDVVPPTPTSTATLQRAGPVSPQLRMSRELGAADPNAYLPAEDASTAQPVRERRRQTASSTESLSATPSPEDRPEPLPQPRMDTRLSEPAARVVKEVKPPSPEVQAEEAWRQAGRLIEQGRNHDARERLESVLNLNPGHAAARQSLIALALETGDRPRAEALLREGQTLHPQDAWYPRGMAQLHLQNGDYAQAAGILKAALARHADAANWALYAGTLGKLDRQEEAARAYREALRLQPAQGNWWIGLAVALEQTGHRDDAGAAYRRALQTRLSAEMRDFAQRRVQEPGQR